jgi:5-enolpyruvylshikimate-3-phosphate synthase
MLKYYVTKEDNTLNSEVSLTSSRRFNNRTLTFRALYNKGNDLKNDPENSLPENIDFLDKDLKEGVKSFSKGKSSVALHFIKHFFKKYEGEWIIAGSEKLNNQAVNDLVDFLAKGGTNIKYVELTTVSVVKIIGRNLKGPISRVDGIISSKFISATLLISPTLSDSAAESLRNAFVGSPYIRQNIKLFRHIGVNTDWDENEILIEHVFKDGSIVCVEADWGNASYLYEMFILSDSTKLLVNGLNIDTFQSDGIIKELFEEFGVKTEAIENGIELTKVKRKVKKYYHDFANNPDLIPCFTVTCALLGIPFRIKGVNLRGRAPERANMLRECLGQLGATIETKTEDEAETVMFDGKLTMPSKGSQVNIPAHLDHRLAMAFSPAALLGYRVAIESPTQVNKTYTAYWEDLKKLGFSIDQKF